MNVEIFSTWLRRQGYQVYCSKSSYWYNAGPRVLQAFPYHWLIQPVRKEIDNLLIKNNIAAIRFSSPFNHDQGVASYHVKLKNPYDLEMLDHRTRNGIRCGLKNCRVEPIPVEMLAYDGWKLVADTLERQGRTNSMTQTQWQKICLSAKDLPGFQAWGGFVNNDLATSLLLARIDDTWIGLYTQSHRDYLNKHINNALFYTVSRTLLAQDGVSQIFYSLHSLDAPDSVNEFKLRMGFIPYPVCQRIQFHPMLRPLTNHLTYNLISRLHKFNPDNRLIYKAEGMLRYYLQGHYPLKDQDWPDCIAERKSELLESLEVHPLSPTSQR